MSIRYWQEFASCNRTIDIKDLAVQREKGGREPPTVYDPPKVGHLTFVLWRPAARRVRPTTRLSPDRANLAAAAPVEAHDALDLVAPRSDMTTRCLPPAGDSLMLAENERRLALTGGQIGRCRQDLRVHSARTAAS
jgi:hypothetical protein